MVTEKHFISLYVSDDQLSVAMHSIPNYMQSLSHRDGCKSYKDNGASQKYILMMRHCIKFRLFFGVFLEPILSPS